MSDFRDIDGEIRNHERRIVKLEQRTDIPDDVLEFLCRLRACEGCGIVFRDSDAYGEHLCHGRQGR